MEQSPKIKFQKDGAALHFLPKSFINLEKQMNVFPARCKFFNSLDICYSVKQNEGDIEIMADVITKHL